MKKGLLISGIIALVGIVIFLTIRQQTAITPEKAIAQTLVVQVDSFSVLKDRLLVTALNPDADEKQLQSLFRQTRLAYKKFEWAAEYYTPQSTRFVNGPPVPEIESGDPYVRDPEGLQMMEGFLFPKYDRSKQRDLIKYTERLQQDCDIYRNYFSNISILNWQIFDAMRLQVFRILAVGITDFDNPLMQNSMQESAVSLQSVQRVLAHYEGQDSKKLNNQLSAAITYLQKSNNFNNFNRAEFITRYANPVCVTLFDVASELKLPQVKYNRFLNQNAKTLFDKNAFNVNAYASDPSFFMSDAKVALGKKLFADPILSGGAVRSCQSCHNPNKAFTDGLALNTVVNGKSLLKRNTPTLINAALQASQFYDLRANTLEDQAKDVVENPDEMHGNMKEAAAHLYANKTYRALFKATFPNIDTAGIPAYEVTNALGSYVRSLVMLNSRFDEYMQGNKAAMNQQEINGFNLFMGKAKCGTCHYMPLFNGTLPPEFIRIESEVVGVPASPGSKLLDTDKGRYNVMKTPSYKHAFKITTLRNAALTAPYMHNGSYKTLEQVMDFYNNGGGAGLGLKVDNQTLAADKLNLSKKECGEVIAFIKALNSKSIN